MSYIFSLKFTHYPLLMIRFTVPILSEVFPFNTPIFILYNYGIVSNLEYINIVVEWLWLF